MGIQTTSIRPNIQEKPWQSQKDKQGQEEEAGETAWARPRFPRAGNA